MKAANMEVRCLDVSGGGCSEADEQSDGAEAR